MQHQDSLMAARPKHRSRYVEAIGVAGAAEPDVEGGAAVAQAQPLVKHAARRRQEVVGRLGDKDQPRHRLPLPPELLQQTFSGFEAKIRRGDARSRRPGARARQPLRRLS